MRKLPNGYYHTNICLTDGYHYIDTGIETSSDIDIEIACQIKTSTIGGSTRNFIFGARDGTSNTSLGINLCKTYSNGYYVGYGTTNTLISTTKGDFAPITFTSTDVDLASLSIFKLSNKIASLVETISYNVEDKTSVASFSGTKTMYLFGLNNNGNVLYAPPISGIAYCKIWKNKVLVKDYLACCDDNGNVGLYEFVENVFYPITTQEYIYYSGFTISPTTNGNGIVDGMIGKCIRCGELNAIPNDDYIFVRWEYNNEILSNENPYPFTYSSLREIGLTSGDTFSPKAIFVKKTDINAFLGYKMAVYSSIPIYLSQVGKDICVNKGVYSISNASISIDGRQKTSSKFYMNENFNVSIGDYVYVYSQSGKNIFNGTIQAYDERSITCGNILSFYDKEILLHSNTNKTIEYQTGNGTATATIPNVNVSFALSELYLEVVKHLTDTTMGGISYFHIPESRFGFLTGKVFFNAVSYSTFASETYGEPVMSNYPTISSTNVSNMYDMLCDIYSELNIYVRTRCIPKKMVVDNIQYDYLDINLYPVSVSSDTITMSNNSEQISNIEIVEESDLTTVLFVANSSGSTMRGVYTINSDGEIVDGNTGSNMPDVYTPKIILSDDNLNTIVQSNLSANKYNHKITFELMLDDKHNFRFDDFKINKRIDFHYANKIYRSVITAISYDVKENANEIETLKITLGMARNNLTSKLNLKKVKK